MMQIWPPIAQTLATFASSRSRRDEGSPSLCEGSQRSRVAANQTDRPADKQVERLEAHQAPARLINFSQVATRATWPRTLKLARLRRVVELKSIGLAMIIIVAFGSASSAS